MILNIKKQIFMLSLLMACLLLLLLGCNRIPILKGFVDDNIIEEAYEQVILNQTGIIIDFTPESPEKHEKEEPIWIR